MIQHAEKEILSPVLLCDKKGNLNPQAIGFAKQPIIDCNVTGQFMRKKKWNYWCVYGEDILFSATISHLDYAAVCFVYFIEYETQRYFEKTVTIPLGTNVKMPTTVLDSLHFNSSDLTIHMTYVDGKTRLSVTCLDFDGDVLQADLTITHPKDDESLNVVIPWSSKTFQFTAKHHTLPTEGIVSIGTNDYQFNEQDCFAVLDYGRGVWPREATWNWGMASQKIRGKRIGLNFGGQWTDATGMTENAIFIDGQMTKIHEDVLFTYNQTDYKKPWHIQTKFTDHVQLTFTPFFERIAKTDLKLIKSEVHQLVGYYNGHVTDANGSRIAIVQMLGCIEEHLAKW
jgi:hypothetical protein